MLKIWSQFSSSPIGELLRGTAHNAHPTDITAPIGVRFAGQNIIALHIALDKAATVRVSFDAAGNPTIGAVRNIQQRSSPEFVSTLTQEANATGAKWVAVIMQTGWQAILGHRAARPESADGASAFYRHKLMFDQPEIVVPKAEVSRAYTAVDHPYLDKSIVFSVKRRELEDIFEQVRRCGLNVAAVRIGVAAQLEAWLATQSEGLTRDLLLTDSLSSLLLNIDEQSQNFMPARGGEAADMPRQAVQRPTALVDDIARHLKANAGRAITFVGAEDICAQVKALAPEVQMVRPPDTIAHDLTKAVFSAHVVHDLNCDAKEVRPALPRRWRRYVILYCTIVIIAILAGAFNGIHAMRASYAAFQLEREMTARGNEVDNASKEITAMAADFADATSLRAWLASTFHAQKFCYHLLKGIPNNVTIDRFSVDVRDGQMTLTFVVLGDNEAILEAIRSVEKSLTDLKFKIGRPEPPLAMGGPTKAVQYRMFIIMPDAAEVPAQ